MSAVFTPVVNSPYLNISGMNQSFTPGNAISVSPGLCRTIDNSNDIIVETFTTVNPQINGLNGLDTGSIASISQPLALYAISDLTNRLPSGYLFSTNYTYSPVLPAGYNGAGLRIIGWFPVIGGTIQAFVQYGDANIRVQQYLARQQIAANFTSTTFAILTGLQPYIPPSASVANLDVETINPGGGVTPNLFQVRPVNLPGTTVPAFTFSLEGTGASNFYGVQIITGPEAAPNQIGAFGVLARFQVTASGNPVGNMFCKGFQFSI